MSNNELILLTRDKEVCTGTFTRITPYSSTILDYVLITKNIQNDIIRMGIDEEVSLLSGSDHVAVRVDTRLEQMENQRKTVQSKVRPLILHQERDLKVVKSIMDKHLMNAIEREKIWMKNAKFSKKSIIVSANLEAYGNAPKPKVK